MKKLLITSVLLFVLPLLIMGCSSVKGGGYFIEGDTGQKVTFSVNLNAGETYGIWTDVEGTLQLNDPSQKVRIHGKSKYPEIAFYYSSSYSEFYAYDIKVNGNDGYWMIIYYAADWWEGPFFCIWVIEYGSSSAQYEWWFWESDLHGNIKIKE